LIKEKGQMTMVTEEELALQMAAVTVANARAGNQAGWNFLMKRWLLNSKSLGVRHWWGKRCAQWQ
jgi:hypothetical protein